MRCASLDVLRKTPVVLCIGAHSDDIEIGCSATLLRLAREYPLVKVHWAVFSGDAVRQAESRAAAALLADLGVDCSPVYMDFQTSYFPAHFARIKDAMESLSRDLDPGVIFTHQLADRHQDHELLARLTWNTFRQHTILEYEIPKYEGDLTHPNAFFPVSRIDLDHKVEILMRCFASQATKGWFTPETFQSLARIRGIECASETGYAEAFHARKLTF